MRYTPACSFSKGAGHLLGMQRAAPGRAGDGETPGRFRNRREGSDSPHPQYAARCRLTITGSPFFAIPTLISLSLNGTAKIPNFFAATSFSTGQVSPEHSFEILTFWGYGTHSFPSLPAPGERGQHTYQSCAFTTGYDGRAWSLGG